MAPQIEFSIQLTEKDVGAAADVFPFRRRLCVLPGVAASLLGIAGTVALIFLQPDWLGIDFPNWLGIDFGVIALGLVLIGYGTLMPKLHRWLLIRQFYRTPAAQKEMSYQVFDDHIVVRSELHYSELRWQAFLYAREIPGYLYLQTSPITGTSSPSHTSHQFRHRNCESWLKAVSQGILLRADASSVPVDGSIVVNRLGWLRRNLGGWKR